jgi:succinate dehydrogenase hydrophobic anchor subunit
MSDVAVAMCRPITAAGCAYFFVRRATALLLVFKTCIHLYNYNTSDNNNKDNNDEIVRRLR